MLNSPSMIKTRRLPLVTGVSPKEGPPGTRITIRGENLGNDPRDLIGLKICGMDCLLSAEWKSPSKIIARTGPGKGKGDILITTRSAGNGSCTVGFRGYFLQTGPLQESAVWIDESQTVRTLRDGQASAQLHDREDEDPLGISSEGDKPKITEEEMLTMFPEACGNLSLENFSPVWYLLENHQSANFEDLKAGLNYMQRKASQRSEEPIAVIRSNLTNILECLDRLRTMYEKFTKDDIRGDCMNSYAVLLMQAKSCADGLFQEVLGRKDRADSTRNALSVLTKFRFLFYLPLNIEKNIQKGDYNIVINDYEKAKSLFADTQVRVFKRVFREVEEQIENFKKMLHVKLLDPSLELEEQKRIIRYLISLEYEGDPAWECLVNQQKWLLSLLIECKEDHIDLERCAIQQGDSVTPGRWKISSVTSMKTSVSRQSSFTSPTADKTGAKYRIPQKVMYVEDLTAIMMENFPDLWKLGQAYFTGEFINKLEISDKGFKIDTSKHSKLKQMISELVSLFTNLIRAAFLPESLESIPDAEREKYGVWPGKKNNVPGVWLPHCVRHTRMCASTLSRLDPSGSSMSLLQELAFDLRTNCMFTLLKQAIVDAKSLHTKETWIVEIDDENGGTTQLPVLFENIVSETIQHLHEVVVQNKTGEPEIFSQRPIQKEATMLCTQLLQSFSTCMEQLAFNPPLPKMESSHTSFRHNSDEDLIEDPIPSLDKRLVIMLSNCSHTLERVIPRMIENLNKHGYVEMQKASKAVEMTYRELDTKLFDAYIEQKSDPIVGAIEANMYRGGFEWKKSKQPTGVRSYLKEMLMGMIEVHAEVYSIFPKFVSRVMARVIEAVCDEMTRLIQCADRFNNNGAVQAHLELIALQDTVVLYKTNTTSSCFKDAYKHIPKLNSKDQNSCFKDAYKHIPKLNSKDQKLVEELHNKFKARMRFQLMCFQPDLKGNLVNGRAA